MSNSTYNYSGKNEEGFTLIELSIVLVIIGLIVGGILTGQDLIKAAEQRAAIAQIEKYNTAVNTFRNKYNCIPGDCASSIATSFSLTTRAGSAGRGDGNGLIDSVGGTNTTMVYGQENGLFWADLSSASLLDGNFTYTDSAAPTAVSAANVSTTFPASKLGNGNYVTTASPGGLNYFAVAGIGSVTVTTGVYTVSTNITPIASYNIDKKTDDGMPETGSVQAQGLAGSSATVFTAGGKWTSASAPVATDCVTGTGTAAGTDAIAVYAVGSTPGSALGCILRFRFN